MNSQFKARICAVTTSRNDNFFLSRWIEWYGGLIGKENLFIFLDGRDQQIPENAGGAHVTAVDHVVEKVAAGDKSRINRVNATATRLFRSGGYDIVIGCDLDEFLAVDPARGTDLPSRLSQLFCESRLSGRASASALGLDVGQDIGSESALDPSRPFLEQRSRAVLCSRYTKPVVLFRPSGSSDSRIPRWGSGFHRIEGRDFHIDPELYLFHFGYCDLAMLKARQGDASRIEAGWHKHLGRRARTISLCSSLAAVDGDALFARTRRLQSLFRPIYAWNKPGSAGRRTVILLPSRFRSSGL